MNAQTERLTLSGPAGAIEAVRDAAALADGALAPRGVAIIAHPHPLFGGTMDNKVVQTLARAFVQCGWTAVRFNFRGVGGTQGVHDEGRGELQDLLAVVEQAAPAAEGQRIALAGFSFGAWVALEVGATDDRVSVLIGVAPPVVTSVSGMEYTFPNTLESTKPKFFVQGEADEVCPLEGMWSFYAKLHEPKELVVIDGADHLFEGKTQEVGEALEDLLGDYEP